MEGRCSGCEHWSKNIHCDHGAEGGDPCQRCPDGVASVSEGMCLRGSSLDEGEALGLPDDPTSLMWASDVHPYKNIDDWASELVVTTRANFGCVMWEPKP